jgi:membrane protease YdiL (CAAX protease family)
MMRNTPILIYFILLLFLCTTVIVGTKMLGQQGAYLAQGYMLTPAIAAILTRLFFYKPKFKDANLRFGRFKDYIRFWLISIGITALSYALFTLLGGITWDLSGKAFLDRLTQQLATAGQDINASLPPGFTPHMMLIIFTVAGLTVFNIIPGIITGFGEEFGHRGFMFPLLYRIKPWVGIIVGGLIWYAWHLPLMLVIPQTVEYSLWQMILNSIILAIGSVCTFTYLAYVYVKSESVWVTSVAHITMNNVAASFSYYVIVQNQVLANIGLTLTMIIVVATLYYRKELNVFREYFVGKSPQQEVPECLHSQSNHAS